MVLRPSFLRCSTFRMLPSLEVMLQDVSSLVVTFSGEFALGGATIPVEAVYTHASRDVSVAAEVPSITINFQAAASQLVGLDQKVHSLSQRLYMLWKGVWKMYM